MPTYNFRNKKTGEVWEDLMTIAEMEKLTKKRHIELLPPTQMNIVSSVGSVEVIQILVGKKHYLKYQKHILIVILQKDMGKDQ